MNVLIAESGGFSDEAVEKVRELGNVTLADLNRDSLLTAVAEADVLWVRLRHRIDREVMAAAPHLKIIVTPTTGLNHIDLDEAERRGIRVLSLRGETHFLKEIHATAEHTIALLFGLLRNLPAAVEHVRSGGWNRDLFRGTELFGKTVGVVGLGRVGHMVARYMAAFGARVYAADTNQESTPAEPAVTFVPLPELLSRADIVTLHVSLDSATAGFFGAFQFAAMRKGSWFINTARGELVDEAALIRSLQDGHLAGAALDVLCGEDPDNMYCHPVVAYAREHLNVIITPHIGGCTGESMRKTERFLAERLLALQYDRGRPDCQIN
jgi:D-3-phosphoglycerate dehydrogenase